MSAIPSVGTPIVYPDSDGKPMSDNTLQARWITTLFGNFKALYRDRADVFVAMDLLWYPVEGEPTIRAAPDVLVAFGRPEGYRGSYKQWLEGDVPVTVAFEVLSPGNTVQEMIDKRLFYEEHGVEEYYVYDPDNPRLEVYLRKGDVFRRESKPAGFVSPLLGVRFVLSGPELAVYHPGGRRFLTFEELEKERGELEKDRDQLAKDRDELVKGNEDLQKERDAAVQQLARLSLLSRKARLQQATAEELAELEELESEAAP